MKAQVIYKCYEVLLSQVGQTEDDQVGIHFDGNETEYVPTIQQQANYSKLQKMQLKGADELWE